MIISRIMGGLGNQMFQYALGRRLALERNVPLKLDLSWFAMQEKRQYELDQLNIACEIASDEDIFRIQSIHKTRIYRVLFFYYQQLLPYWKRNLVQEKNAGVFDLKINQVPNKCILSGYWQTEMYFNSVADIIKNEYTTKNRGPNQFQELKQEIISNQHSVSVHIRRGDYVSEFTNYWICSEDYYQKAINWIGRKIKDPKFYFFSDDIEWSRNHIVTDYPSSYVEPSGHNPFDMELMRLCQHHINANSSFSWWGAWLGENQNSIVIAPNQWFTDRPYPKDSIPERWIRL